MMAAAAADDVSTASEFGHDEPARKGVPATVQHTNCCCGKLAGTARRSPGDLVGVDERDQRDPGSSGCVPRLADQGPGQVDDVRFDTPSSLINMPLAGRWRIQVSPLHGPTGRIERSLPASPDGSGPAVNPGVWTNDGTRRDLLPCRSGREHA
jgi:hypothetical protein